MICWACCILWTAFVCFIWCCIIFTVVDSVTNLWLWNASAIETSEFAINTWWICATFFVRSIYIMRRKDKKTTKLVSNVVWLVFESTQFGEQFKFFLSKQSSHLHIDRMISDRLILNLYESFLNQIFIIFDKILRWHFNDHYISTCASQKEVCSRKIHKNTRLCNLWKRGEKTEINQQFVFVWTISYKEKLKIKVLITIFMVALPRFKDTPSIITSELIRRTRMECTVVLVFIRSIRTV